MPLLQVKQIELARQAELARSRGRSRSASQRDEDSDIAQPLTPSHSGGGNGFSASKGTRAYLAADFSDGGARQQSHDQQLRRPGSTLAAAERSVVLGSRGMLLSDAI